MSASVLLLFLTTHQELETSAAFAAMLTDRTRFFGGHSVVVLSEVTVIVQAHAPVKHTTARRTGEGGKLVPWRCDDVVRTPVLLTRLAVERVDGALMLSFIIVPSKTMSANVRGSQETCEGGDDIVVPINCLSLGGPKDETRNW